MRCVRSRSSSISSSRRRRGTGRSDLLKKGLEVYSKDRARSLRRRRPPRHLRRGLEEGDRAHPNGVGGVDQQKRGHLGVPAAINGCVAYASGAVVAESAHPALYPRAITADQTITAPWCLTGSKNGKSVSAPGTFERADGVAFPGIIFGPWHQRATTPYCPNPPRHQYKSAPAFNPPFPRAVDSKEPGAFSSRP
jgi:hypothetical protein